MRASVCAGSEVQGCLATGNAALHKGGLCAVSKCLVLSISRSIQ